MPTYSSTDLVTFGMLAETVEGTLNTAGAYSQLLTNGITPEFSSNFVDDPTISGEGEPADKRTNLRGFNLQTPATLRYGDCQFFVEAALRDSFPAEVSIVMSGDCEWLTAGTHLDGSTGPQLKSTLTGDFDTFINYDGATAGTHPNGGAEGLMMKVTGATEATNNGFRRIKAVHDDASNGFIDLYPGYAGGTVGQYGEPITADTLDSPTLAVGAAVRNRLAVASGTGSFSALWQFTDMAANASWQSAFGLVANDLVIQWAGKEGASIDVPWVGYGSGELVNTDPTAQGFDATALLYSPMLTGADDLATFAIVTDTKPIVLSALNLTGFNYTLAGNVSPIEDVSGTSEVTGIRRGAHNPEGSIDWYLVNDARSEELTALGSKTNNEKAGIDCIFTDADGNTIVLGMLHNEFSPTGPAPGGGGNTTSGTLNFSGHRRTNKSRSFVWQEFVAP